ncbi:hypothetical protein QQS21_002182 [Conoideocrella luteorostrata]|uniref:Uncharacterized protein n=1 Tax=Conoideocrella luteorostrata TaxID=1105319 RepID=A0AAJ0CWJ1_9HYPO|nr:hypothetical protein QQS21_002182 [Conoideocrella luteorostrata]
MASWDLLVDERIGIIVDKLNESQDFSQKHMPGLKELLIKYLSTDENVGSVEFCQRLLRVFKDSETDYTYSETLGKYDDDEQRQIKAFVAGTEPEKIADDYILRPSLGCREELGKLLQADCIFQVFSDGIKQLFIPDEDDTDKRALRSATTVPDDDGWFENFTKTVASSLGKEDEKHGITVGMAAASLREKFIL